MVEESDHNQASHDPSQPRYVNNVVMPQDMIDWGEHPLQHARCQQMYYERVQNLKPAGEVSFHRF